MPAWLVDTIRWLTDPVFTALANVFGVLGFCITIVVFCNIRKITQHYGALIRLPELRTKLEMHATNLGDILGDFETRRPGIGLEMAKTIPTLRSIKSRLRLHQRSSTSDLFKNVKQCRDSANPDETEVRRIFNHMHGLIGELVQWEQDSKWRN